MSQGRGLRQLEALKSLVKFLVERMGVWGVENGRGGHGVIFVEIFFVAIDHQKKCSYLKVECYSNKTLKHMALALRLGHRRKPEGP